MVRSCTLPGTTLREHIKYFHYLLTNFNIVCIVGDYNGGVQFLSAANESSIFKDKLKIDQIKDVDFTNVVDYPSVIKEAKNNIICPIKNLLFTKIINPWIRRANELLQANFNHKRIKFAGRAVDDTYHAQRKRKYQLKIKFSVHSDIDKQAESTKMIDFMSIKAI